MDLELARNEASHKRVTLLIIEIDVMKADKITLETQNAEQRVAAYALKQEEEAQRAAKAAERDAKWTADDDATIERMIGGGSYYSDIALELGNGLTKSDTKNRWQGYLKELSGIIKPAVQAGRKSCITWTADVDASIVRMRTDCDSFTKIASDIKNRWTRHLKDKLQ